MFVFLSLIVLVSIESFAATAHLNCGVLITLSNGKRDLAEEIIWAAAPDLFVLHSRPLRMAMQNESRLSDAQKNLLIEAVKVVIADFKLRADDKERPLYRFYEGPEHLRWLDRKITQLLSEWEISQ